MDHNPLGDDGLIAIAQFASANADARARRRRLRRGHPRRHRAVRRRVQRNTTLKSLGMENPSRLFTHQSEHVFHAGEDARVRAGSPSKDWEGRAGPHGIETLAAYGVAASRTWSA